jgi:hypothetical protein
VRTSREGTAIVRVRDIGRVELAKQDYSIASRMNGRTATTIGIYQQPGANAVETAAAVRARLAELKRSFPTGLDYKIALDTSLFTLESIDKVVHTFFEAVVLVVLVVFLFLQSLRATIIPILAVPVSIIGTFIGMHLLGFSINMLTMFGMILAIGLVVDDAIVVVENVETNMTKHGLNAMDASTEGHDRDRRRAGLDRAGAGGGVPAGGLSRWRDRHAVPAVRHHHRHLGGHLRRHGADAVAGAGGDHHQGPPGREEGLLPLVRTRFRAADPRLCRRVARAIQGWPITLLAFGAVIAGIVLMFRVLPGSFVPDEDQGYFFVVVEAPDTASQGVAEVVQKVEKIVAAEPSVQDVASVNGFSLLDGTLRNNAAVLFVSMKPFDQRGDASMLSFAALPRINQQLAGLTEGFALAVNPPPIPGLGTTGGFEMYLQNRGAGDQQATSQAVQAFMTAARAAARAGRRQHHLPRRDAAALRRPRSQQGRGAGRVGAGRVPDHAGLLRLADRRAVHPVQPRLVGGAAGRRGLPRRPRRLREGLRARTQRHDGAAVGADQRALRRRAQAAGALQRLPGGEGHRQRRRPATARARRWRRWRRWPRRRCRRTSRSPGRARRCRRRARAAPRPLPSSPG